jgi:hypothetical protein
MTRANTGVRCDNPSSRKVDDQKLLDQIGEVLAIDDWLA